MKSPQAKLSWGRKLGYASGDFALNLFFTFTSLFLLYYYTDIVGLSPTVGGLIIMAALVWEGVIDPLMGVVANRTRSRWGRYRPYILFGSVPLAISFVAMFVPTGVTGTALVVYAFATHLLFRTLYTVVGIPLIAMSADMTRDTLERSTIAGARMLFATGCGLTLATATLPLVRFWGGGQIGFFKLSILYSLLALIVLAIVFRSSVTATADAEAHHPKVPGYGEMLTMVRANQPFQLLLGAIMLASVGGTATSKMLLYYIKYHVGSEALVTPALMLSTATVAASIVPWVYVTRWTSKRFVWLCGTAISFLTYILLFILAPGREPLLWALIAMGGVGSGAYALTFWSMVPDTVEYGEVRTGIRAEGALYGLVSLSQKVALGIGIGLIGVLLDTIGYHANVVQTKDTLDGILILLTLVPAAFALGAGALIWFYPLDRATHAGLLRELATRPTSPDSI